MSENLIEVKKLVTQFSGKNGTVTAVDGVSFHVKKGETLGIVGESGCGKSVTSMSILRLIPKQTGKIASGEILFEGRDLAKLSEKEMRQIRGNEIAMIFQDSMTGLNPVMTIGKQLVETITAHSTYFKKRSLTFMVDFLLVKIHLACFHRFVKTGPGKMKKLVHMYRKNENNGGN